VSGKDATPRAELPPLQGTDLLLVTIAISLATFMEVLDMTIVNVSVPSIAGTLGVSPNEGTWTITSYTLAAAIMQPLTGWLARRFGEVRTFTASTLLFVISSALCGMAVNMPMLVAFRLMQGLVSGPMAPMAQSLLMRSYPPEKRGAAMGIWGMVVFVAPIFGPILGGWITDNLSWPWLFYINVPVGLIASTAVWGLLRRRETPRHRVPVDITGLMLLFAGVGALQFMLDNGNEKDWFGSPVIVTAAVVAAICLTLLIAWELTERHPVVDLHLFQFHNFRVGMSGLCAAYAAFFGITVIVPLFLETTVGYTATRAGMASAPVGLLGIFLLPIVGAYLPRLNMRVVATVGFLLMATVTYWLSGLTETVSFWQYAFPRVFQGVGMSFIFLPMQQILLSDIDAAHLASAAGLSNFLRNLTGSMSTAGSIWLWSNRTDYHHAMLAEHVTAGGAWNDWSARMAAAGFHGASVLAHTENVVMQQARVMGANDLFRVLTLMLIVMLPLIWLARPPFSGSRQRSAH
jgi:MFS transporter, DHA2 family, multidrug resistance protein